MDRYKIRLGHTDSVDSVDRENFLDVQLQNTSKKFHFNDVKKTIDQYELFKEERSKCTRYRLIMTINPYCTNVLFNPFTEIVNYNTKKRVIDNSESIGEGIDGNDTAERIQMIANTEYSCLDDDLTNDKRNYTYYPGYDIFDNHLFRNKSFKVVSMIDGNKNKGVFNTLGDTVRDANGSTRQIYVRKNGLSDKPVKVDKHLYVYDEILPFEESVNSNLYEENGWFGFINHSNLITVNQEEIVKVLNDHKACEFIDMYPGRNLFSFSPTYNKRLDRLEQNWDIVLTYPYENDYNNQIVFGNGLNALKIMSVFVTYGLSEEPIMVFRTFTKHNLKKNDTISVWYATYDGEDVGEYQQAETLCRVKNLGDLSGGDEDYYFYIDNSDFLSEFVLDVNELFQLMVNMLLTGRGRGIVESISDVTNAIDIALRNLPPNTHELSFFDFYNAYKEMMNERQLKFFITTLIGGCYSFRFQKIVNGSPSKYYIRKFRKLPNFKVKKREPNEIDLENKESFLNYTNENAKFEFDNERYKLGFATTIYTDDCTQITYTDTIDIAHLRDNLNRPVSEIYATIIKRNKGNKIWYGVEDGDPFGEEVEQSHCFSRVIGGLEISHQRGDSENDFVNRAYTHDVRLLNDDANGNIYISQSRPIDPVNDVDNNGITAEMDEFLGDVIEFVPNEYREYVLSDVQYRFNTYQRDNAVNGFLFSYHEIRQDDYDVKDGLNQNQNENDVFELEKITANMRQQRNEGYFYKAHYQIPLREFGELQQASHFELIIDSVTPAQNKKMYLKVKTTLKHNLCRGDIVLLCDDKFGFSFEFVCSYVENARTFYIIPSTPLSYSGNEWNYFKEQTENRRRYGSGNGLTWLSATEFLRRNELCLRRKNMSIPDYAVTAGKNIYLWRDLLDNGNLDSNTLPEYVYTNNAFYVTPIFDFYLKRQDPDNTNEMYAADVFPNDVSGRIKPKSIYEYEEDIKPVC